MREAAKRRKKINALRVRGRGFVSYICPPENWEGFFCPVL